ncbi:hypothetical protein PNEG_03015 [Pneumocystis murina B123]|uniref:DASH complex subunit DAD3 n=1 Tax=Pneumocystis murina (strain B123) TaxID=1069680 RepID=M7PDJ4_PNEMU|nr:hypothetical protein PNEG_03015 [Pneumocystis murina B123]EMR08534.1 hypothetical protein PNEG_03015 [Pneumocystis murina B123]
MEKTVQGISRLTIDSFSSLEIALLQEYSKLAQNLNKLSNILHVLAHTPMSHVLDSLSILERKTGLVFTLFKASVWAILANAGQADILNG